MRHVLRHVLVAALASLVLVVGLAAGCASPTLPLPPPQLPTLSVTSAESVHLESDRGAEPNALIVIVNQRPSLALNKRVGGAVADDVGSWNADVEASSGDELILTQESGTERSPPQYVKVP